MNFTSNSSHVSGGSFDPVKKQMIVTFKNGHVYTYHNVTLDVYNAFKNASSHGEHLAKHIKDKYQFTKG